MIYILKFDKAIGSQKHQANFYIGYCDDGTLEQRIAEHRRGVGAAITRWLVMCGIGFEVVATLPGDRAFERRLKNYKNTRLLVERLQRGTFTLQ